MASETYSICNFCDGRAFENGKCQGCGASSWRVCFPTALANTASGTIGFIGSEISYALRGTVDLVRKGSLLIIIWLAFMGYQCSQDFQLFSQGNSTTKKSRSADRQRSVNESIARRNEFLLKHKSVPPAPIPVAIKTSTQVQAAPVNNVGGCSLEPCSSQ